MLPRRAFTLLLAACALALCVSASAASPNAERPAVCWVLDSPQAAYVSDGGLALLHRACAANAAPLSGARAGDQAAAAAQAPRPLSYQYGRDAQVNDSQADAPPNTTQNEVTVHSCGQTLLAAWNDSGGSALTGYGRSTDGGATWLDLGAIPGFTGTDPGLASDRACRFYYSAITFVDGCEAIGVSRSLSDTRSWGPVASASFGIPCSHFQDKSSIAIDNTAGLGSGFVYACWDDRGTSNIGVFFSRSLDGGLTFTTPVRLATFGTGFATGCQVRVAPNGDVLVVWTKGDDLSLNVIRSRDWGMTFGPIVHITGTILTGTFKICGGAGGVGEGGQEGEGPGSEVRPTLNGDIRTFNWPSFAINPTTGSLHIVWNDGRRGNADIFYVRSDDGTTWSAPVRLNDDTSATDQFQPALAFTRQGLLRAAWYDRRQDPQGNLMTDVYSATSADDGQTFAANERITDQSFGIPALDPNFDPGMFPCYMGDYIGVDGGSGVHYMVWGDNRNTVQGHPDPDIFFERRSTDHLGDVDCDGDTDYVDVRKLLRSLVGLGPAPPCLQSRGDTDCNGAIGARDGLAILVFLGAAPPLSQQQPCQAVGV
jgi:hypothetical protein